MWSRLLKKKVLKSSLGTEIKKKKKVQTSPAECHIYENIWYAISVGVVVTPRQVPGIPKEIG